MQLPRRFKFGHSRVVRHEWVYWGPTNPTWLMRGYDAADYPIAVGDLHEVSGAWVWEYITADSMEPWRLPEGLSIDEAKALVSTTLRLTGVL